MDDKELHQLLFSAVQHDNISLLDDLLESEGGRQLFDLPDQSGNTLLHVAVLGNRLGCIECLLRRGANPNAFDTNRSRTPLHLAIEYGLTDAVEAILRTETVNLDLLDDRNLTCYEIAQLCDNPSLAELIKSRHEEISQLREDFYSVINQACSNNEPKLVQELLEIQEKRIIDRLRTSGWLAKSEQSYARSQIQDLINWSSSSWNDVTLLFKSASRGFTEVCKVLIDFGASAKCNQNTNYSPLYVAAYGGYTDTVRLLLDNFPALIREITIEKWTVLHACCLQGHSETARLILSYPYPHQLKRPFLNNSGCYEYQFAFDLNAQDAAGQTVVFLAVSANNEKLLDNLLHFNIDAKIVDPSNQHSGLSKIGPSNESHSVQMIPDKPKILDSKPASNTTSQIHKIIRQLRKLDGQGNELDEKDASQCNQGSIDRYLVCPFDLDTYCDYNSKTALHLAVERRYHKIATTLLVNGSNPNLPILTKNSSSDRTQGDNSNISPRSWLPITRSSCLKEACQLGDETMCEILIRYGARDQDNSALEVAAAAKNSALIAKLLALNSNIDPEFKINKKCNVEFASRYKQAQRSSKPSNGNVTTFNSMFPTSPVMIDWQNLRWLRQIDPQWLIEASLCHNKRLKHPTTSLIAITRLDLSSNNLKSIHPVIFRLPSLRVLNLSKNRLESITNLSHRDSTDIGPSTPTMKLIESHRVAMKRSKSANLSSINLEGSNIIDLNEPQGWDLPYLEVLDLHDNLLISLPDCIFELPKLRELDVSSNQIRQLPSSMWSAPSLKELVASGNLLDDLPKAQLNISESSISPSTTFDEIANSSGEGNTSKSEQHSFEGSRGTPSLTRDYNQTFLLDLDDYTEHQILSHNLAVNHLNHWDKNIDIVSTITSSVAEEKFSRGGVRDTSRLSCLNLSHNSFSSIPPVLACVANELARLNLSYNRLTSIGQVSLYPATVKTLDLAHNQICTWFQKSTSTDKKCYAFDDILQSEDEVACIHRMHDRLDHLRSLNLSHNYLKEIHLNLISSPQTGRKSLPKAKSRIDITEVLLFPNVTALDLSFNKILQVPQKLSELKDLSVLNLSGNSQISTLPAQLGLATKLWNLGVNGCSLNEPLKSIVESKTYKTMDIIGYLRSILDESKPYVRMKLMLVGLQGIGKTSLLEQIRQEGSSGLRRKLPEHWTKRMGHASRNNLRNQKGVTLSTVGVDIHDWTYCKRTPRGQTNYGPVSFSTWDFGGQEEFYATHRYFLSKRSIYLVVWRLTDALDGINGIQQWLVNIQSRAPGSPVIIVGTHEDMIEGIGSTELIQKLQDEVHGRFIDLNDHDKCGLPRVVDSIVVSTKTKLNIKYLCDRIYDVVFGLKCPGTSERLLEQKIPATYLYLEEIVSHISHEKHLQKRAPVLTYGEYRKSASEQLKSRYNRTFRDLEPVNSREINYNSELQQATRFLHENGVLLHYEDANLRDLYFLDPQWLCDILSHVVTIREINPHVKNGLMRVDDLGFLFRSMNIDLSGGVQSYVVNLLNKFEVALTWNSQYLLIPSLLPPDMNTNSTQDIQVKVAPRSRGRSAMRRFEPNRANKRSVSIEPTEKNTHDAERFRFDIESQPMKTINRLVLLRYLPAGFLARLQSGILSDVGFDDICADMYSSFLQVAAEESGLNQVLGSRAGWNCWKRGIKLSLQRESTINSVCNPSELVIPLLTIEELTTNSENAMSKFRKFMIESMKASNDKSDVEVIKIQWSDLNVRQYSNIVVISIPGWRLRVTKPDKTRLYIEPDHQAVSQILATSVEHIDSLLEDWYPSLGARFAHTLGGNYLVTRVAPCNECFNSLSLFEADISIASRHMRQSRSSRVSDRKIAFPGFPMIDPIRFHYNGSNLVYSFYVESCILAAYDSHNDTNDARLKTSGSIQSQRLDGPRKANSYSLRCPNHGSLNLSTIAPDIMFEDVATEYRIVGEQIERCKLIGRGTFGFVYRGSLVKLGDMPDSRCNREVALKLLQPYDPGSDAEHSDILAYRMIKSNWEREPFECVCKSYCTARHEVNILQTIRHPNIVLFIGLCIRPLAIVLELAPMGCLTDVFKNYKKSGMYIDQYSAQKTILQISRALEFIHQQRIIYRDLKAENVLVWSFPTPFATRPQEASVELKLADYGISRQVHSTGIWKGFAGTMSFLAPEILRHNGDEEYTEKVDCFSFGVFMYELLTLRPLFKHNEAVRSHLSDGMRPTLTIKDLIYPSHMIDLMSVCWSQEPHLRPTSSQIVSIASTPEFMQLYDAVALDQNGTITGSCAIHYLTNQAPKIDLWIGQESYKTEILSTESNRWVGYQNLIDNDKDLDNFQANAMGIVDNRIWICDSNLMIHLMPLGSRSIRSIRQSQAERYAPSESIEMNRVQTFSLASTELGNLSGVSVLQMLEVKCVRSVVFLLRSGNLWVLNLNSMKLAQLDDDSIQFKCMAIREQPVPGVNNSSTYRILCGQSNGISCLDVRDQSIFHQSILPLTDQSLDLDGERILDSSQSTEITSIAVSKDLIWTAAGCTVHLWNLEDRSIARKLDCWKLVPCSESLESFNIESYYEEAQLSRVSSLVFFNSSLFVGTSHGCLMVVEASSLKPMIVFRPYESDLTILAPIVIDERGDHATEDPDESRYLVTIGTGYRDLMKRYVSSLDDLGHLDRKTQVAILWSGNYYNP